jgi:hypothetical protein
MSVKSVSFYYIDEALDSDQRHNSQLFFYARLAGHYEAHLDGLNEAATRSEVVGFRAFGKL